MSGALHRSFVADRPNEGVCSRTFNSSRLKGVAAADVSAELVILRRVIDKFPEILSQTSEVPCRFVYTKPDGRKIAKADRLCAVEPDGTLRFLFSGVRSLARIDRLERLGAVDGGRPEYLPVIDRGRDLPITNPWNEFSKFAHQLVMITLGMRDDRNAANAVVEMVGTLRGRAEQPGCLKFRKEVDGSVTLLDPRRHEILEIRALTKLDSWQRGQPTASIADKFPPGSPIKLTVVPNRGFTRADEVVGYVRSYTTGRGVSELVIVESEVQGEPVFHGVYLDEIREVVSAPGGSGAYVSLAVLFSRG
jgi:hypothetical protein